MSAPPTPSRKRSSDSSPESASKRIKPVPEISAVTVRQQIWPVGSTQLVSWSSQGDVPNVNIRLCGTQTEYDLAMPVKSLASNLVNTGSAEVEVPTGLSPGEYVVRLSSSCNHEVQAFSSAFTITCDMPPVISGVKMRRKTWPTGSTQRVSWTSRGEVLKVDIKLFRPHTEYDLPMLPLKTLPMLPLKTLAFNLVNTDSAEVEVPVGLVPGEYLVRVESSENRAVFDYGSALTITCDTPPSISSVEVPQQIWPTGSTQLVSWSSQGEVPKVTISLCLPPTGDSHAQLVLDTLALNIPNTGSAEVEVPAGLAAGEYRVRVASSSNRAVRDYSSAFTITCDTPPAISSVKVRQQIWHGGSTQLVSWSSQGEVPKVHIKLCRPHNELHLSLSLKTLAFNLVNTGSAQVEVPVGVTPGEYIVRVVSSGNRDVREDSSVFTVDDEHRERCVRYALLLLGLPPPQKLPYAIVRKIAVEAATESPPAAAAASTSGAAATNDAATSADGDATDAAAA